MDSAVCSMISHTKTIGSPGVMRYYSKVAGAACYRCLPWDTRRRVKSAESATCITNRPIPKLSPTCFSALVICFHSGLQKIPAYSVNSSPPSTNQNHAVHQFPPKHFRALARTNIRVPNLQIQQTRRRRCLCLLGC